MTSLYEHLPEAIRHSVDELVDELRAEDWPTRFLALIGLLGEKLKERADPGPALLLQQWAGLVTAVMEKLPPDIDVMESAALMSISYNDTWRAQALARIDRDLEFMDNLVETYPAWPDIVESLAEAGARRPIRR
ncbi:hypothetical protein [Novosphingobium resinovorum]|uniref:Uncharacterized protein n=1 Tax=Novosphingobium resinovorum TaxID=158500 RepID=A0A1D8A6N5_9SPHN|nr:hypothetical protein [Novosphingobium resinovorum]AOR77761.1 hypothetical protein BES08_14110 [Novosphingobium resinovorum]